MDKPLLSLCIPTYNRSQYLKKSIDSIICQQEFLDGKVEIVISDNASEDDTREVVDVYLKKYDNIFYQRNVVNVRDKNFPIVLSEAHGTLRRLCNDTLIFLPGSLAEICSVVEKYSDCRPYICWANGNSKPTEKTFTSDFKEYVHDISFWMTSILCFSIWDTECCEIKDDTDGCELLLWQVRKGLELACSKNSVLVINKKLSDVQAVEKKNISYGLYKVFYENYFKLLEPYFENDSLDQRDKEYLEKDLLFHFFSDWCVQWELQDKKLQYSETEDLKKLVWNQYKSKPYWNKFLVCYYLKLLKCKGIKRIKSLIIKQR